jgi:hypothetical protein
MFNYNHLKYLLFAIGTFGVLSVTSTPASAQIFDLGFAGIAQNIADSLNDTPRLVGAISYLLAIAFGVLGLIKLKDHVENPNNTALKIPTIHFLVGGALFALPTVISAAMRTINGGNTDFNPALEDIGDAAEIGSIAGALNPSLSFNEIFTNIVYAMSNTPLLVYVFAYLAGVIMIVSALLKLKEHVEDPNKAPLRTVVGRMLIAGALLTLPTLFNAMATSISPNYETYSFLELIAGVVNVADFANAAAAGGADANAVLGNILNSTSGFPILISSLAYFLGLVIGLSALFKIKEHIEDERTPLREGVIRAIVAGALIALPVVLTSMYLAISGIGELLSLFGNMDEAMASCEDASGLGGLMCNLFNSTSSFPFFLTVVAYMAGTAFGFWAILQFQEHVTNPQQVKLWDPFSKTLVAGGLFSLPTIVSTVTDSLTADTANASNAGFNEGEGATSGLDGLLSNLMVDVFDPFVSLINWFGILAGFVLIFIGITRLMKSAQEGAKGPGGIGTIMTFIAGGALISFSPMISVFMDSMFNTSVSQTYASLAYTAGMDGAAITRSNTVIAAIMRFVLLLGLISIMRGIFIVRGVSEGNSQASMMAGMTHIVGGAAAVNLGGIIQAVQTSLGITTYGLTIGG